MIATQNSGRLRQSHINMENAKQIPFQGTLDYQIKEYKIILIL